MAINCSDEHIGKGNFRFSKPPESLQIPQSEDALQQECYQWFHNTYPQCRGLLCYNLNNSRNKIDGARNRAKGLRKGRSDFALYFDGTAHMIELKTLTGKQSEAQIKWEAQIRTEGFPYYIVHDIESFQKLIRGIVG